MTLMRSDPAAAEQMLGAAIDLLNKTIQDVRRYIFELSDGEGQLAEAMGLLVSEMRSQSAQEIEYRLEGTLPRYPVESRTHLLQIAREAIINALKHAKAQEIVVALSGNPDALVLTVTDNGRGLPPGGAFRPGGQGVPNLRARTSLLGGTIRWVNRAGGGAIVELTLPHHVELKSGEKGSLMRMESENL